MTVHMIRVICEDVNDIENEIQDWAGTHSQVLLEEGMNPQRLKTSHIDKEGVLHVRADYYFSLDESKRELIESIENVLKKEVSWYLVGYHACDHDSSPKERKGCKWNKREEFGPVPNEVHI